MNKTMEAAFRVTTDGDVRPAAGWPAFAAPYLRYNTAKNAEIKELAGIVGVVCAMEEPSLDHHVGDTPEAFADATVPPLQGATRDEFRTALLIARTNVAHCLGEAVTAVTREQQGVQQ